MAERVWPFPVNWSDSFQITYDIKTEIQASRSGKEQRIGSPGQPRRKFEFSSLVRADSRRTLMAMMAKWGAQPVVVAEAPRQISAVAGLSTATATFTASEVTSWMTPGRYLVFRNGETFGYGKVLSVAGASVTLTAPPAQNWPAGTRIYCGAYGKVSTVSASLHTDDVWSVDCTFSAAPGADPLETEGAAAVEFNGREVLQIAPNWATEPDVEFGLAFEEVDADYGPISTFFPISFTTETRRMLFTAMSRAEGEALREWFFRMDGQLGEFYMPSGSNDLPPLAVGSDTLTVAGREIYDNFADSTVYKALCVRLKDGTEQYRAVTGIALTGGNSILSVDSPWTLDPATISRVSWMPVWRFAGGSQTIEWLTDSVAQATVSLMTLEDLPGA